MDVKSTPEDEAAFNDIRWAAQIILSHAIEPDDVIEINRYLAELEPYPSWILKLEEVK